MQIHCVFYEPWTYVYKVKEGRFVFSSRVSVCDKLLDVSWLFTLSIDDFYRRSCRLLGARGGATVHCATSRKVAGSIPYSDTGNFHWHNRSGRTTALASTQPLTEMSTRNISWGKGGRCVGLTTFGADCLEILGASTFWSPQGLSRPVLDYFAFCSPRCLPDLTHNIAFTWGYK
jgi:hypothetical protein